MKAKTKISGMLHSSFKPDKCKTSLKMAVARIKLLKNKREVLVRQMRRDLAQLLGTGQDQTARIRVEHVIREEKTMAAYDLIDVYCELIVARMAIIDSQKNCPIDLKEAISSVIFASPRCADIPELMDIRKHFAAKYSKEFITAALEVRPDSGVSRLIVEKLSAKAPDIDTKVKVLTEVAKEHNIHWNPKAFEEQIQKPKDDLLDGPSVFTGASKMTMDSSIPKALSAESWNSEPPTSSSEKFVENKQTMPNFNVQTPANSLHSKASEDVRHAHHEEKRASSGRSDWNMEFKDAASAAKAAAESAEMASMAARAAAELASQGNVTAQSSLGRYQSSTYATRGEQTKSSKISKLDSTQVMDEEAEYAEHYRRKSSHHRDADMRNIQSDYSVQSNRKVDQNSSETYMIAGNLMPKRSHIDDIVTSDVESVGFSRNGSSRTLDYNPSEIHGETGNLTPKRDLQDVGEAEDLLYEDDGKAYNTVHPSFSDVEPMFNNFDRYENQPSNSSNHKYEKSASSYKDATYDNYSIWDDYSSTNKVEDSVDVSFDHYESDTEDHSSFEAYREDNLFNSSQRKQGEEYTNNPFNRNTSNNEQRRSDADFSQSESRLFSSTETKHADYAETITDIDSKLDHNMPPSFDSDIPKSESDDEINTFSYREVTKTSSFLLGDSKSNKGLSPARSGNISEFMDDKEEITVSFPDIDDRNFQEEQSSRRQVWSRPRLSVRNKQQTPRAKSPESIHVPWEGQAEEEPSYSIASVESYTGGTFDIGRLKGGRRNRDFDSPKVQNTFVGSSLAPKRQVDETSSREKNSDGDEYSATSDFSTTEWYEKGLGTTYRSSRSSRVSADPSVDDTDKGKVTGNRSSAIRNSFISQVDDEEDPVQELYNQLLWKEQKQSNFRSSLTKIGAEGPKEHSYATRTEDLEEDSPVKGRENQYDSPTFEKLKFSRPNRLMFASETRNEEFSDQKQQAGIRMQSRYSDSDYKSEDVENATKKANKEFKLSRRTKGGTTDSKLDFGSGADDQSNKSSQPSSISEPSTKVARYPGHLDKVVPKSTESYEYDKKNQAEQGNNLSSPVKGTKGSSKSQDLYASLPGKEGHETVGSPSKQTSPENSLRNSSHIHPKLPDYDTLAAHFHSLWSNVRPK